MTPQLAVKLNWMDNPGQTHSFTFFKNIFFLALLTEQLGDMTGSRLRERGNDKQQRAPGRDSNPGLLQ